MVSGMRVSLPPGPHLRPPTAPPGPAHRPAQPRPAPPDWGRVPEGVRGGAGARCAAAKVASGAGQRK